MQRAHAIANGLFVAAPNRAGFEATPRGDGKAGIEFWGQSFLAHLAAVERARTHWSFLRDRRMDAYAGLTRRWLG